MDEDEVKRRWQSVLGASPDEVELDPTTTLRQPEQHPSGAGSSPPVPWEQLTHVHDTDPSAVTSFVPAPEGSGAGPSPPASAPGLPAGPSFELREVIGQGGMGVVFRAVQQSLQREVAVKKLHPSMATASLQVRFIAEAMVAGLLDHPNVVPVHDVGRTGAGELLIAMKLARGPSWKRLLRPITDDEKLRAKGMDLRAHLDVLLSVCNAVAYAHSKGVVHLDLKPENVLVGEFGEVLVMDWGVAAALDLAVVRPGLGHVSGIVAPCGTPAYMSPELAAGEGDRIGPWTDVYLLGAILCELLTGAPPHKGKGLTGVVLSAVRGELPVFPPSTPAELQAICLKALAPLHEDRYPTVAALKDALQDALRHGESARVAQDAARALAEARSAPGNYARYAEAVAGFRQAGVLWEGSPAARAGELEAREAYARAALALGDLGLARAQAGPLAALDRARADALLVEVQAREAERERAVLAARRTRRALGVALAAIVVGLAAGLVLIEGARRRAEDGERVAAAARDQATRSEAEASRARDEAQRRLADALLGEGRTLGALGRWDAARERLLAAAKYLDGAGRSTLGVDLALLRGRHEAPGPLLHLPGARDAQDDLVPGRAVALAEEASVAAWGWADGRVVVRDRRTTRVLFDAQLHLRGVTGLALSADGRRLVSGGQDGVVRVVDLSPVDGAPAHEVAALRGDDPPGPVLCVALSPDGRRALSGGADGRLRWWTLEGSPIAAAPAASFELGAPIRAVALVWDGSYGAAVVGTKARTYNLERSSCIDELVGPAELLCVDVGYGLVAAGDGAGRLLVREVRTGKQTALAGHAGALRAVRVLPTQDGALATELLTSAEDGSLRRWDVPAARETARGEVGPHAAAAFAVTTPGALRAATIDGAGALRLFDLDRLHGRAAGRELPLPGRAPGEPAQVVRRGLAVDPTGVIVLGQTSAGAARVWDVASGRALHDLGGHTAPLVAVAATDGLRGLTVSEDGAAVAWDLARGVSVGRALRLPGPVRSACLLPGGDRLLAGLASGEAVVVDLASGEVLQRLAHGRGPVLAVAATGDLLATAGEDRAVRVWSGAGAPVAAFQGHDAAASCVGLASTRAGPLVVAGAADGWLRAWEARPAGPATPRWSERAHAGAVAAVTLVDEGRVVLSAGSDGTWTAWDATTGAATGDLPGRAPLEALAATPDGRVVVTGGPDGVRLWDVDRTVREALRASLESTLLLAPRDAPGPPTAERLQALGAWFAESGTGEDAALVLLAAREAGASVAPAVVAATQWARGDFLGAAREAAGDGPLATARKDAILRDEREEGTLLGREPDIVRGVELSPDGRWLVSSSRDATLSVWDVAAGALVRRLRHGTNRDLQALALSADGRRAITGGGDDALRVWDLATGAPLATLVGHTDAITCAAALGDGGVVSGSNDGTVRVWPPQGGAPRELLRWKRGVRALAVRGGAVAAAGDEPEVVVVDLASGAELRRLEELDGTAGALRWLADGRLLVMTRDVRVYDAEGTGYVRLALERGAYDVAASPDGRTVAVACGDGGVRFFDLASRQELRLVQLDALPLCVAWSPKGDLVAVGLRDGQVRLLLP